MAAGSMSAYESTLNEAFLDWFSRPEAEMIIRSALRDVTLQRGREAKLPQQDHALAIDTRGGKISNAVISTQILESRPDRDTVPDAVQKSPVVSPVSPVEQVATIKPFFFPNGRPLSAQDEQQDAALLDQIFPTPLALDAFFPVTTLLCGFPSYCNTVLFKRVCRNKGNVVSKDDFSKFWKEHIQAFDPVTRLFRVLRHPSRRYLIREDFQDLVVEIVHRHPGLEFLEATPEFQQRYVQTVIARIFYMVNRSGNEKITLQELRRSNFYDMLTFLDEEDDINKIHDYFSYEHFYVIYCKFWELDHDHDFVLDTQDLLRYDNFALTRTIVSRIMAGAGRPLLSGEKGRMSYEDFVIFFISDVDKRSPISLDYWFKCVDLDGDGLITMYEMEVFFSEQQERIQALSQDDVHIEDVFCQLSDMVKPAQEGIFTRRDLRNCRMAPHFFNMLFNLHRYATSDAKDPVLAQQRHETPELSDWDRHAISEYYRLAEQDDSERQDDDLAFNSDIGFEMDMDDDDDDDLDDDLDFQDSFMGNDRR